MFCNRWSLRLRPIRPLPCTKIPPIKLVTEGTEHKPSSQRSSWVSGLGSPEFMRRVSSVVPFTPMQDSVPLLLVSVASVSNSVFWHEPKSNKR